jgi:hypothetical protein
VYHHHAEKSEGEKTFSLQTFSVDVNFYVYTCVWWQSILNINFSALHQRFVALSVQR